MGRSSFSIFRGSGSAWRRRGPGPLGPQPWGCSSAPQLSCAAYSVFGSFGLWADRYAIPDLTPPHERLPLGAFWEVIRLGLAFAVCLRIISGKFQRQWRALLHEPGSRWSRRSSIALAGAVIFAATAYHIDAGLAPFQLVKNRAANLLGPSFGMGRTQGAKRGPGAAIRLTRGLRPCRDSPPPRG